MTSCDFMVPVPQKGYRIHSVTVFCVRMREKKGGWYRGSGMNVVNFIISSDLLENKIKDGAGLLNPLNYYLR